MPLALASSSALPIGSIAPPTYQPIHPLVLAPPPAALPSYFRRWFLEHLLVEAASFTKAWQGTIFLPMWMSLMGASIGKRVEISSTTGIVPGALHLGTGSFIADSVVVAPPFVHDGVVRTGSTVVGEEAFVGNGSFLPVNSTIPDKMLVGLQSEAPRDGEPGSTWLGTPAISLSKREGDHTGTNLRLTYQPSCGRVLSRGVVELLG